MKELKRLYYGTKKMSKTRNFKKVFITGITGSGGSYLAEFISWRFPKVEIHGTTRWHSTTNHSNLKNLMGKIFVHECDLTDFSSVFSVLKKINPEAIFHLASHANVRASFTTPLSVVNNNILGTINLLEAIRLVGCDPVIQICSTSEVYGQVSPKDVPIKESCAFNPSSPYAVSKATQDLLGFTYYRCYKLKIIRTRMFAYINPRREDLFASSFARQVAAIELGRQKILKHGNLNSVRTLIDVRDAMEAYWVALEKGKFGEAYNLGGNKVITVRDFLEVLKDLAKSKIETAVDKNLLRPADVTLQIPDVSKFRNETGWKPKYSFVESVKFLLNYWRDEIKKS